MQNLGNGSLLPALVLFTILIAPVYGLVARDMVFVVLSHGKHQTIQAQQLRDDLQNQAREMNEEAPTVHLAHEEFPHPGAWTVFPILSRLSALHGTNSSWVFFCESYTKIILKKVIKYFGKYNPSEELWIGHALYDREPTIIHHFAFIENTQQFKYPYFGSGFAMSNTLLRRLSSRLAHEDFTNREFSIDPSHELALFVWDNGRGPALKHMRHLCLTQQSHCASFPQAFQPCGEPVERESIYFGVKTCGKFHKDRIPVVKKTWAKYATNIGFYSDIKDPAIPTINLGVPNTENGHCGKTFAILNDVALKAKTTPAIKWVVIADDDTIMSVARLQQLLSCFDPSEAVALGERYGYNVHHQHLGYNYITGGGGMVFSIELVFKIVRSKECRCPSISTPDDMFLGICLARLGVPIIHSPSFHQARPSDYAPEYLINQKPVSFHKHWMVNPVEVYNKWFAAVDQQLDIFQPTHRHAEL
ncbi:beta-1,3-glucosyltransferase isoform X2 [Anabrus simplex]|uniref:beta-1,3-glucosyltransferase isoform X2 n=1 Tax=Anabrus simplex TaxID=316456 RepID=UPI0034DD3931